jgi:hypothetical protein
MGVVATFAFGFCGSKRKIPAITFKDRQGTGSLKETPNDGITVQYKNTNEPNKVYVYGLRHNMGVDFARSWFKSLNSVQHITVSVDEDDKIKHNFYYYKEKTEGDVELNSETILKMIPLFCESYILSKKRDCIKNVMVLFLSKFDRQLTEDENINQHGLKVLLVNSLGKNKFEYACVDSYPISKLQMKEKIKPQGTFEINKETEGELEFKQLDLDK